MTRVKICGITTAEDAAEAAEAGADALGFIFVPGTPRAVLPEAVERIVADLPPFITTVGVFADRPLQELLGIVARCRLQAVQLHGEEPADVARSIPLRVIKGIRVKDAESLRPIGSYPAHAFLLDAFVEGMPGGTGSVIPWDLAARAKGPAPIILSGGLRPENVDRAIRLVHPYAVDVSSGVEMRPGRKDRQKVREFIAAVRRADQS
ncbi:MAG TPA: phosphoribosylanthranilate isomerase [Candidatus Methylomirabilis sp.]|nr:phosphoribosylanthranilate isomerase [Candidatus Methylomirabilis sp.]HSC69923.1 phosphoribosylanthranilate isomerase [Candidatus Methylomirabilis sp.]